MGRQLSALNPWPAGDGPAGGRRGQHVAISAALLLLAGAAWVGTVLRMSGMDAGPGTDPGALGFFLGTWVVMMAAMMFPSIAPVVSSYASLKRERHVSTRTAGNAVDLALFVAAYLATWLAAGLAGYVLLKAGRALDGGLFAWRRLGRWSAALVILAAAAYQLSPRKSSCLRRCRDPHAYLLTRWHDGPGGATRMGVLHGAWCMGCCWALMAALFALGAMSIVWMVAIAAGIAAEKLLPSRVRAPAGVAVLLGAVAIGVAAAPARVPALTIPGGPAAMRAMRTSAMPAMKMSQQRPMSTGGRR